MPAREGRIGNGLLTGYPIARGLAYWFRFPSLLLGRKMTDLDFTPTELPRCRPG
jgi:hypothetical protein